MKLYLSICQNGLGHFVRTTRILDELMGSVGALDVTVAAGSWQWSALQDDELVARVSSGVTKVDLGAHPMRLAGFETVTIDQLHAADEELFTSDACRSADLVWSDNLTGALRYHPRTILSGSFLWGAVLRNIFPQSDVAMAVAEEETALLGRHQPEMLCVGALVMPDVVAQTRAVSCGLMTEPRFTDRPHDKSDAMTVGLFGGATGLGRERLQRLGMGLQRSGHHVVSAPSAKLPFDIFEFGDNDWERLDVAYCRPGLGTIHDCAGHGIPMVMFYEQNNLELHHNASRVEALGFGIDANEVSADDVEEVLKEWTSRRGQVRARLRQLRFGGVRDAAKAIATRLIENTGHPFLQQAGSLS